MNFKLKGRTKHLTSPSTPKFGTKNKTKNIRTMYQKPKTNNKNHFLSSIVCPKYCKTISDSKNHILSFKKTSNKRENNFLMNGILSSQDQMKVDQLTKEIEMAKDRLVFIYKSIIKNGFWKDEFQRFCKHKGFDLGEISKNKVIITRNKIQSYIICIEEFWILLISYLSTQKQFEMKDFISLMRFAIKYVEKGESVIEVLFNPDNSANILSKFSVKEINNFCVNENIPFKVTSDVFLSKRKMILQILFGDMNSNRNKKGSYFSSKGKRKSFTPKFAKVNISLFNIFENQENKNPNRNIKEFCIDTNRNKNVQNGNTKEFNQNKILNCISNIKI